MATVGSDRYIEVGQRLLIAAVILIFTFALPWYLFERFMPDNSPEEQLTADDLVSPTATPTPSLAFVSDPITTATAGKEYRYRPQINYEGEADVTYKVEQKPSWLEWNQQELILSGTAPKNLTAGQAQLVRIVALAGDLSEQQSFTVQVVAATTPTPSPLQSAGRDPFAASSITPRAAVLGAATEDLPDTALSPTGWLLLSTAIVAVGFVIIRWQWQHHQVYRLSTGARLEVKQGRRL